MERFDELRLVEGVEVYIGATSFPSGHTMAGFALFGLLAFLLPKRYKGAALLFFLLALIVALSRVYLVQHFVKDIYLGAWLGLFIAILAWWLFGRQGPTAKVRWLDLSLRDLFRQAGRKPRA